MGGIAGCTISPIQQCSQCHCQRPDIRGTLRPNGTSAVVFINCLDTATLGQRLVQFIKCTTRPCCCQWGNALHVVSTCYTQHCCNDLQTVGMSHSHNRSGIADCSATDNSHLGSLWGLDSVDTLSGWATLTFL